MKEEVYEPSINKIWRSGRGFIDNKFPADKKKQEAGRKGGLARAKLAKEMKEVKVKSSRVKSRKGV